MLWIGMVEAGTVHHRPIGFFIATALCGSQLPLFAECGVLFRLMWVRKVEAGGHSHAWGEQTSLSTSFLILSEKNNHILWF